jgi:hypothetical protein
MMMMKTMLMRAPRWPRRALATVVYIDGSCRGNGTRLARGGYGVFFGAGDPRNQSRALPGAPQTNQRAEIAAAVAALRAVPPAEDVVLNTDSAYVMNGGWHAGKTFIVYICISRAPPLAASVINDGPVQSRFIATIHAWESIDSIVGNGGGSWLLFHSCIAISRPIYFYF